MLPAEDAPNRADSYPAGERSGLRDPVARNDRQSERPIFRTTQSTAFVIGIPRAVKPVSTATRTWNSATRRSKSRAIRRRQGCFTRCIVVSTRLWRSQPLHRRQMAPPMPPSASVSTETAAGKIWHAHPGSPARRRPEPWTTAPATAASTINQGAWSSTPSSPARTE